MRGLFLLLFLGCCLSGGLVAQAIDSCAVLSCYGPSFMKLLSSEDGSDMKVTTLLPTPEGGYYLGGTLGSDILLARLGQAGNLLWQRRLPTMALPSQLFLLNRLVYDNQGMLLGAGSLFNAPTNQRAFLFRFDPTDLSLLYYHEFAEKSEISTLFPLANDALLLFGSDFNQPSPVFQQGFNRTVSASTGLPMENGRVFDYGGREQFLNAVRYQDSIFVAGVKTLPQGGAGGFRASLDKFGTDGNRGRGLTGHQDVTFNSRLLAFDLKIINQTLYLLHWGSNGVVSGDQGTRAYVSAFTLALEPLWTRRYDIPDYEGEQAVNIIQHNGGLLFYGRVLTARQDLLLTQIEYDGSVRWSKAYELPGNCLLYWHGNQQIFSEPDGIFFAATYSVAGQPNQAALFRTDSDGNLDNPCLGIRPLAVQVDEISSTWQHSTPAQSDASFSYNTAISSSLATSLVENTTCSTPCCDFCPQGLGMGTNEVASICAGETYWFNDTLLNSSGLFRRPNDCEGFDTLLLSVSDLIPRTEVLAEICQGDTILINGQSIFSPGIYLDTLSSISSGCDSVVSYNLIVNDRPFHLESIELCAGDSAWVFDQFVYNSTRLERRFATGEECDSLVIISIDVVPPIDVVPNLQEDCTTSMTQVNLAISGGRPPYQTEWSDGGSGTDRRLEANTYTIGVYDQLGCFVEQTIEIQESGVFSLALPSDTVLRLGDLLTLSPQIIGAAPSDLSFNWSSSGPAIGCVSCPRTTVEATTGGDIQLQVANDSDCTQTATMRIRVDARPRLYIPTAFSPNGDGINDVFAPLPGPEVRSVLAIQIYDRWGGRIYQQSADDDPTTVIAWDGTANDIPIPIGVYMYQLELVLINGQRLKVSGEISLLR